MRKTRTTYDSPIDALVGIVKRLCVYEEKYRTDSESFFTKYNKGEMPDTEDFVEWSNDYQHYIRLKIELEERLEHAA